MSAKVRLWRTRRDSQPTAAHWMWAAALSRSASRKRSGEQHGIDDGEHRRARADTAGESVAVAARTKAVRAEETQHVGEVVCHSITPLGACRSDVSVDSTFIWSVDVYRR